MSFFAHDFTAAGAANGTDLSAVAPDVGTAWVMSAASGTTFSFDNNRVHADAATAVRFYQADHGVNPPASAEYYFEATYFWVTTHDSFAVCVGLTGPTAGDVARYQLEHTGTGRIILSRIAPAGVSLELYNSGAGVHTPTASTSNTLRLERTINASGNPVLVMKLDGVQVGTAVEDISVEKVTQVGYGGIEKLGRSPSLGPHAISVDGDNLGAAAATIAPTFIASTATVYSPTIDEGAAADVIAPSFIGSTAQVFSPTIDEGAAGGGVTITDEFTNATGVDVSLADHIGDTGHGWSLLSGSGVVQPGDEAIATGASELRAFADTPLGSHDATGEWEIRWSDIDAPFRMLILGVDIDTYVRIAIGTNGIVRPVKRIGGADTSLTPDADYGTPAVGQRVKFKVEVAGTSINVWWSIHDGVGFPAFNASPDASWTDADVGTATGRLWGFGSLSGGGAAFNRIAIVEAADVSAVLLPGFIASTATVFTPAIDEGAIADTLAPTFIASTATVYSPTVDEGVPGALTLDLFAVCGQSNAQGVGDSTLSPNVPAGTAYEYTQAAGLKECNDPVGGANTGSAWPAFVNELVSLTGWTPVILEQATGGSAQAAGAEVVSGNWDTTGTHVTTAIDAINEAIATLTAQGHAVRFRGVIWAQGGRDSQAIDSGDITIAEYRTAFDTMRGRFRTEFGADMPFWISRIGRAADADTAGWQAVRAEQDDVAASGEPFTYMAWTGALGLWPDNMGDNVHYSQAGYGIMGEALATFIADALTEIAPTFIASTATVFAPTVDEGALPVDTLQPAFIASNAEVFAPTVDEGLAAGAIAPGFILATSVVHAPVLLPGAVTLLPAFIVSGAVVFEPVISGGVREPSQTFTPPGRDFSHAPPARRFSYTVPARD